jgi:cyanophycin synthetase
MNITDFVRNVAQHDADRIGLLDNAGQLSFAQYYQVVSRIAGYLRAQGVAQDDGVLLRIDDEATHFLHFLACAHIGAVSMSVSASVTEKKLRLWCPLANTKWALTYAEGAAEALELPQIQPIDPFSTALSNYPTVDAVDVADSLVTIVPGSGSTGNPKLIPLTHRIMIAGIESARDWITYERNDIVHTFVSSTYLSARRRLTEAAMIGSAVSFRSPIVVGAKGSDLASVVYATPSHIEQLLSLPVAARGKGWRDITFLGMGASRCPLALRERIKAELTENLAVRYGTNEAATLTACSAPEVFSADEISGQALASVTIEIVGPDGAPCAVGETGEIRLKAPGQIDSYLGDDDASAKAFRDGWFYPRDRGYLNKDGQLFHLGRIDDMMIVYGMNVHPLEVENGLHALGNVAQAIVVSIPDQVEQEKPVAMVVLEQDTPQLRQAFIFDARNALTSRCPRHFFFVDTVPSTPNGKPDQALIREMFAQKTQGANNRAVPKPSKEVLRLPAPSQLAEVQTFKLNYTDGKPFDTLDPWFRDVLLVDLPSPREDESEVARFVRFVLAAYPKFCAYSDLPFFVRPQLLAITKQSGEAEGNFAVQILCAKFERVSPQVYTTMISQAVVVLDWMMKTPLTPQARDVFYTEISKRIVDPVRQLLTGVFGKSTFPVLSAAYHSGIPFQHLGGGVVQLGWGARARLLQRSITEHDSALAATLSKDKLHTAQVLAGAGLPTPVHLRVTTLEGARNAFDRIGQRVVIKPADGNRGEGVTVDITDKSTISAALDKALEASMSKTALVEKQVDGLCHRLFMQGGELLYCVARHPVRVHGDGTSAVRDLIAAEQLRQSTLPKWKRDLDLSLDAEVASQLAAQQVTLDTVPAAGRIINLRRIESTQAGGVDEDLSTNVHPENKRIARAATELFGLYSAGVDIITSDISKPWLETGAIINEVNFAPLLGGAAISRSYLPKFLDGYVGSPCIPVQVFVGGEGALKAARSYWQARVQAGVATYVTSHAQCIGPNGPIPMPLQGTYERTRALILNRDVEELVVLIQNDEFLLTGLPLEAVSKVTVVDNELSITSEDTTPLAVERTSQLLNMMRGWPRLTGATD